MRVFDFDGTIYDGESLFDLYLYSARHDPKVFRYICLLYTSDAADD